jgi:hypothetical protein
MTTKSRGSVATEADNLMQVPHPQDSSAISCYSLMGIFILREWLLLTSGLAYVRPWDSSS